MMIGRIIRRLLASRRVNRISTFEEVQRSERDYYIQILKPAMMVFDVGANIGDLTMLFSRIVAHSGEVHAFEPTPSSFARLIEKCRLAGAGNVRLNNIAVGERTGTVGLHLYSGDYHPWNTRAVRPLAQYGITDVPPPKLETVDCTTLDSYCDRAGIGQIDLLKIDVEGAELEVLWGAERMLRARRIRFITFEFGQTTFDMGHTPQDITSFLKTVGYAVRNLIADEPMFPGGASVETAAFSVHVAMPADSIT